MSRTVDLCHPDELAELVQYLDEEFVFGRGRQVSLARRLESALSQENLRNIYVARQDGRWMATASVKKFTWLCGTQALRGAMIGLVFTKKEARGAGLGSLLMKQVQARLQAEQLDFSVLWTGIPDFYRRLGWISRDDALFGRADGSRNDGPSSPLQTHTLTEDTINRIENIRNKWEGNRAQRSSLDYRAIPLPAESVDVVEASDAYALVGRHGETGYVYEVIGNAEHFLDLWTTTARQFDVVFVNDCIGTSFTTWSSARAYISWNAQQKAMWLPLSKASTLFSRVRHIPYFDRI